MITERDLDEAIAACQGEIEPNSQTCIKLAAFLTIKNELFPKRKELPELPTTYSFAPAPIDNSVVSYDSGTEFSRVISGRQARQVFAVLDELMGILSAINPRLYNATLNKIEQ